MRCSLALHSSQRNQDAGSRPTPGAGCSITSATTVSTTGAAGCFTFRATFFTGARLALALAAVFAALRGLPLRSFARLCTFDPFLRLAPMSAFDPKRTWEKHSQARRRLGSLEVGDHHCLLNGQVSRQCKFKSFEFRNRMVTHAVMIGKSDFEQSSKRI